MYLEKDSEPLKSLDNSVSSIKKLVAILVVICAIAAVTFTVLYVTTPPSLLDSTASASGATLPRTPIHEPSDVTDFPPETWEGHHVSWLYSHSMDARAKPCESFHHYVCGQYSQLDSLPVLERIAKNVSSGIREEFLKENTATVDVESSAKRKAYSFFSSCMASAEDDAREGNSRALMQFMRDEGLSYEENADFLDVAFRLLLVNNIQAFFALEVEELPQHGQMRRFIRLVPSVEFERWATTRGSYIQEQKYEQLVKNVLAATGIAETDFENFTSAIRQAEDKIMNLRVDKTLIENANVLPATSDWETYLSTHSGGVLMGSLSLDLNTETAKFVKAAQQELGKRELFVLLTFEVTRHLANISGLIDSDREKTEDFCFGETYAIFKHAVISPYLLSVVNESKITEVMSMIKSIVGEVEISIRYSYWLGRNLSGKLQNKIRTVKWRLGYAAGLGYWGGVDKYYQNFSIARGSFLGAYLTSSKAYAQHKLSSGTMALSHTESLDFANDELRIQYDAGNYVSVAAAAMTAPLFNLLGPPEVNYGALGSIVTRQLMRAFDAKNRLDGGSGTEIVWSSKEQDDFRTKFNCRQRGTTEMSVPAVSFGAHALYRAYKKAVAFSSARLPGMDNLSKDQIFFITRCFLFCGGEQNRGSGDTPALNECNILAEDSLEFAAAFYCPPGSPMNPKKKCDTW